MYQNSPKKINRLSKLLQHIKKKRLMEDVFDQFSYEDILTSTFDVYKKIPILKKEDIVKNFENHITPDFRSNFNTTDLMKEYLFDLSNLSSNHDREFISKDGSMKWIIETTSGSTGQPFPIIKSQHDLFVQAHQLMMCRKRNYRNCTIDNGFLMIHQTDPYLQKLNYRSNYSQLEYVLRSLETKKPYWMFSTSLLLKHFYSYINGLNKKTIVDKMDIAFIETTSQKLCLDEKKTMEDFFSSKLINNYGTREFWNIGYECLYGNLHFNNNLLIELIDENGVSIKNEKEVGEVLLTSLTSYTMPLVKYYLGDILSYEKSSCPCGLDSVVITLHDGRAKEKIKNTNDYGNVIFRKVLRGIYFYNSELNLKKIKIIQTEDYNFDVYVLISDGNWGKFICKFKEISCFILPELKKFNFNFIQHYPFNNENLLKEQLFINEV